jgi:O-methyltransferase involved in polyketide biosynthesis
VLARKWHIQKITAELVDKGYGQIIILGAGFDHLGYHYSQKGLSCFEIDAPQMTALKQQFLHDCYPGRPHPDIIPSHFSDSQPVPEFTKHPKIDKHGKTIVVAEGFFDYLTSSTVDQILSQIRNYFSHNTALISTHFAVDELPSLHRHVFEKSVKMVGEELRLNASINTFKDILTTQGYKICQLYDAQEISENIQTHIKTSLQILKGFYILSAKS